jgi:hypothetical protein
MQLGKRPGHLEMSLPTMQASPKGPPPNLAQGGDPACSRHLAQLLHIANKDYTHLRGERFSLQRVLGWASASTPMVRGSASSFCVGRM